MPALLSAQIQLPLQHFFDHVAVAHLCANHFPTVSRERFIQTEVAHHGADERVLLKLSGTQQIDGSNREDLIAIDDLTFLVTKENAVGVAIVREARLNAALYGEPLNRLP